VRNLIAISFICIFFVTGCKKEKPKVIDDSPIILPTPQDTVSLQCGTLPPTPVPFGWTDTTVDENKNVNAFLYNPVNLNQIYYVVNGDLFAFNKFYLFDLVSQTRKYLGNVGNFLPQISPNGWIVFSRNDLNIYKIKTNGDSLTQLTFSNLCSDPKWNYTNSQIYYFQVATNNLPSQIVIANLKGQQLSTIPTEFPNSVLSRLGDKMVYLKTVNNRVTAYNKNLATNSETLIVASKFVPTTNQNDFFNLALDRHDENIYWSNANGIFKCNLTSLKLDTVFKNCATLNYNNPILSSIADEMTYSCKITKALNSTTLFYEYKTYVLNTVTREMQQIRIFP
jgi:hypothetical protein